MLQARNREREKSPTQLKQLILEKSSAESTTGFSNADTNREAMFDRNEHYCRRCIFMEEKKNYKQVFHLRQKEKKKPTLQFCFVRHEHRHLLLPATASAKRKKSKEKTLNCTLLSIFVVAQHRFAAHFLTQRQQSAFTLPFDRINQTIRIINLQ